MEVPTTSLAALWPGLYAAAVLFEQISSILDPEPRSAALNMAVDEALLQRARVPALRVYGWRSSAVSFGYFGRYAEAEQAATGRELVRRWTGGGLVEHGEDLTYTLIVPRDADFFRHTALESYRLIHERIAQWLTGNGLETDLIAETAAGGAASACFVRPVQYDIVACGVKIAGAAQRRTRWGLLHQGSIQAPIEIRRHADTLCTALSGRVAAGRIDAEVQEAAEQIAGDRYATDAWMRKF